MKKLVSKEGWISIIRYPKVYFWAIAGILMKVTEAIHGKAPGVLVSRNSGKPGSETSIRVRGVGRIKILVGRGSQKITTYRDMITYFII